VLFSPSWASDFSLRRQSKVTKREAAQHRWPAASLTLGLFVGSVRFAIHGSSEPFADILSTQPEK